MLSLERIYSQVYKNIMSLKRNAFRLSDVFVWPIIFLFTLTFFAVYMGSDPIYLNAIILGMMGWRMIYFLNLEIVTSFTEEHWHKSLPHLLISPISRLEFAIGSALSGLLKGLFVIIFYLLFTNYLYGFSVTNWPIFGLAILFFALIGFSMGLLTLGFAYFAKDQALNVAFIWPDVIVLLSGVYFSIDAVYPSYLVPVVKLLPSAQAFELLKSTIGLGTPNIPLLTILTTIWLLGSYLVNGFMYDLARKRGKLTRLG
ncbi:MAG: ABC transporter permease [Candidatus Bilamarchaeum sp.]